MSYNAITGSAPYYLSELLHLYSPSCSLRSSSDTRMFKLQRFNHKTHGFLTFSHFGPHIWNNLPKTSAALSSFKSKLKTFLSRASVCVCVHLLHSYAWTLFWCLHYVLVFLVKLLITVSISLYIVCSIMLVQRFEPQDRRFTNFPYYY